MRHIPLTIAVLTAFALPAAAQRDPITSGLEVRSFAGAYFPTGNQRDDFKPASTVGVQLAQEVTDHFHVLGSVGWTHGHNKFAAFNDDVTYVWNYDVGVEANALHWINDTWLFRPLVGVGFGGRTYDYQATNVGSSSCTVAYGNAGTEFQRGVVALRLDARDYVTCFKSPVTARKSTRNDMSLTFGLVYHIR
jgi:hypothetical protein